MVQLTLALEDLLIQLLPVLLDGVLVIVIDGNSDGPATAGLLVCIMELADVRMTQCFCGADALAGVEVQQPQQ